MGFFADNYFSGRAATAQLGKLTMPLGPPELKGNAPPSNEDVAAVSVACLADPATHAGRRYRPTGPKLLRNVEIAETIGGCVQQSGVRVGPDQGYRRVAAERLKVIA